MVQEATAKIEQILDSRVKIESKAFDFFESAEITGDATEQDTAHGLLDADFLGRVPLLVWTEITSVDVTIAGTLTIVKGTHDATNAKVTASTGIKYKVYAI